jgi:hypothetical protein
MSKITRTLAAIALAGGMVAAAGAAALAQAPGDVLPNGRAAPPDAHRWGDRTQMRERMQARRQQRLQVLHDALGLRSDQESAWQAFAAASAPPAEGRRPEEGRPPEGAQALTTPERLDRMQRRMEERRVRFEQRAAAIKRFYAVLDARQQKTFDALVGAREGGRMGFGRRFGDGPGRWGHSEG